MVKNPSDFGYPPNTIPRGITLDDLMKSNQFLKSFPKTFSIANPSPNALTESKKYKKLLDFVNVHKDKPNLQQLLVPVFCTSVMALKEKGNVDELNAFVEDFKDQIPNSRQPAVNRFLKDEKVFTHNACLFSTQNMNIEVTYEEAELIKNFINIQENSDLRRQITSHVELIPKYEVVPSHTIDMKFSPPSVIKDITILQTTIPNATQAVVSDYSTDVFAAFGNNQVMRFNGKERSSQILRNHSSSVTSLSLSSTGSLLLSTDIEGNYSVWSQNGSENGYLTMSSIWCSCFAPQGGIFGIGSDQCAFLYDASRNKMFRSLVGHLNSISSIKFHPNCALVGTTSSDGTARIWDVRTGMTQRLFLNKDQIEIPRRFTNIAFSDNGQFVAYYNGNVCVANIGSNAIIADQPVGIQKIKSIQFSQDSNSVFIVETNGEIQVLTFNSGDLVLKDVMNLSANVIDAKRNTMNELNVLVSYDL